MRNEQKWIVVAPEGRIIPGTNRGIWTFEQIEEWAQKNEEFAHQCRFYKLGLPYAVKGSVTDKPFTLVQTKTKLQMGV